MNKELLEEIGLTKSEINVYLALLELGSSSTGKIVDKSGASSSKIYEILDKLMQKGLVSFIIKSGVKYFEAAPPERIMDYMMEKEEKFNQQKKEINKIIPELKLKQKLSKYKSEATIFKGLKGGETAFRYLVNSMTKDDEWVGFVISFNNRRYFDLLTKIHEWRAKKGLKSRMIFNEKDKNDGKVREKLSHTKVKYVPDELQTPSIVNVAGNITLINVMAEEITVFMIESKEVADSFRNQFEMRWNQDTVVSKSMGALSDAVNNFISGLEPGEDYRVFGATFGEKGEDKKYADFFRKIHKRRLEEGIKGKMLFQQESKEFIKKYTPYRQYIEGENTEYKFLPYKTDSPVATFSSKNRTLLVIQKKEPIIITINNKEVSKSFNKNFEALWNQEARVLKGIDAVQDIFEEMLKYGEVDFIGARGYFVDERPKFIDEWEKRAIKKGFKMRNIVDPEVRGHRITTFPFVKTKYTLPKEFSQLSVFWIYGNRVVITNWMEKEPIVIIIDNKNLYNMYKQQFELLWKKDKF
ncbi:hypothetical protein CEE44_04660 [Candidatus Woesearchaeota archaeon B3_Woes]|nr:MAG: hypothetical protein CEE44_04660 [Candidatus Woesearchaeota archaeon B3_Woes]